MVYKKKLRGEQNETLNDVAEKLQSTKQLVEDREVFPTAKYNNQAAKQRLLQIPVAAIRCGNPESGISRTFLMQRLVFDCDHLYQTIMCMQVSPPALPCAAS